MLVEIKDLNFTYKTTDTEVIKDFTLEISEGQIISILGQSGSGKSTLLRLIAGLEVPSSGEIILNNKVVFNDQAFVEPEHRGIGMVFQDYALFPHMTIEKNVGYGLKNMNKEQKQARIKEVLELVNLQGYEKRYPFELSGGQQQRVALARALAPSPSLLLLDEPFSNLDADLKAKIRSELKMILKNTKTTTLFVTHDIEDANDVADCVVYLVDGKFDRLCNI